MTILILFSLGLTEDFQAYNKIVPALTMKENQVLQIINQMQIL